MSRRRQCPFCLSLSVVETERMARLIDCGCTFCHRRWTEARARVLRSSEEPVSSAGAERSRDIGLPGDRVDEERPRTRRAM